MNEKWKRALPFVFVALAALSRWPNLLPLNFSVFYALAFCAGAFFPRNVKWWLPMGTLIVTDTVLDLFYYHSFNAMQVINWGTFLGLIWFGTKFKPSTSFVKLLAGGIVGAILFYLVTNTAAWLFNPFGNPEYTKDLAGWLTAMTMGTHGHPPTIEFFRNTLLSGGLFTGLFAGAMKLTEAADPEEAKEPAEEAEPEGTPDEAET